MYRYLYNLVKTKIPKISSTEMTALRSGNTSLDRYILQGKFVYPERKPFKKKSKMKKLIIYYHLGKVIDYILIKKITIIG